jgi:hypothetical protein
VSAGVVALSISAIGALSALVGAGFGVRNRLRRLR